MEVQFNPELEKKLNEISAQTGQSVPEIVQDVLAEYVEGLAATRETLDRRYDDIKSGKVKLIPGEEVFARLREKSEELRKTLKPRS